MYVRTRTGCGWLLTTGTRAANTNAVAQRTRIPLQSGPCRAWAGQRYALSLQLEWKWTCLEAGWKCATTTLDGNALRAVLLAVVASTISFQCTHARTPPTHTHTHTCARPLLRPSQERKQTRQRLPGSATPYHQSERSMRYSCECVCVCVWRQAVLCVVQSLAPLTGATFISSSSYYLSQTKESKNEMEIRPLITSYLDAFPWPGVVFPYWARPFVLFG